jgi:16S rRNA (cytosine967-C5)-methyltransferase
MVKRYLERFGREETEKLLIANNEKPYLTLRINAIKTTPEEFKLLLEKVNLKYHPGEFLDEFVHLHNLTNITAWEFYIKGYFNIQDESAGLAVRLLDVQPGMNVLDLCAAPGGKTAYLGSLMKNTGVITALDKYEGRLKLVRANNSRLGLTCVKTIECDAFEFESEPFDRVLADVPCSGTGTLSKKPDIKWKRDIFDLKKLNELQLMLITKAATLVKTGGALVYSTCSIEPEENFGIVNKFLAAHPNFKFESAKEKFRADVVDENGCIQTLPQRHQMDGAFAAKLIRIE